MSREELEQLDFATAEDLLCAVEPTGKQTDVHKIKAAQLFGVTEEAVTPEMRRIGKQANYFYMYGGQQ